ncbi:MAG: type II toxin-antitoxin system Phd/YefM family antitoxin [Holosporales bacterium]|jgi:prevent-host-death family protein
MTTTYSAYEAKTHLSALLDKIEQGDEVIITRHNRPVARVVAYVEKPHAAAALQALAQRLHLDAPDWQADRDAGHP